MCRTLLVPHLTFSWPLFTQSLLWQPSFFRHNGRHLAPGTTHSFCVLFWHFSGTCANLTETHLCINPEIARECNTSWNNPWQVRNRNWWINAPRCISTQSLPRHILQTTSESPRGLESQFSIAATRSMRCPCIGSPYILVSFFFLLPLFFSLWSTE